MNRLYVCLGIVALMGVSVAGCGKQRRHVPYPVPAELSDEEQALLDVAPSTTAGLTQDEWRIYKRIQGAKNARHPVNTHNVKVAGHKLFGNEPASWPGEWRQSTAGVHVLVPYVILHAQDRSFTQRLLDYVDDTKPERRLANSHLIPPNASGPPEPTTTRILICSPVFEYWPDEETARRNSNLGSTGLARGLYGGPNWIAARRTVISPGGHWWYYDTVIWCGWRMRPWEKKLLPAYSHELYHAWGDYLDFNHSHSPNPTCPGKP